MSYSSDNFDFSTGNESDSCSQVTRSSSDNDDCSSIHGDNLRIVVCILTTNCHGYKTKLLSDLFCDDLFIVKPFNIPVTKNLPRTDDVTEEQAAERYRITKALKYCQKNYPNYPSIVIKDNSISASSSDVITKTCLTINQLKYDVCYLCVWLDRCDLYKKEKKVKGTTITINETHSPHGLQALMFSPKGRKIVLGMKPMKNDKPFPTPTKPLDTELNDQIENGNIKALCTTPNLFLFDVSTSDSITDLAKMSVCRRPEQRTTSDGTTNYVWLIVGAIILLVVIWIIWKRGDNDRKFMKRGHL